MASDIVGSVLNWKSLDIEFLNNFIDEYDLCDSDIVEYHKEIFEDTDINGFIFCALDRAYDHFKLEVIEYMGIDDGMMDNFEPNIYINCMDSGYDSILSEYDISDFSSENLQKFIDEIKE